METKPERKIVKILKFHEDKVKEDSYGRLRRYYKIELDFKNTLGKNRFLLIPDYPVNLYSLKVGSEIAIYQRVRKDGYKGDWKLDVDGMKHHYKK